MHGEWKTKSIGLGKVCVYIYTLNLMLSGCKIKLLAEKSKFQCATKYICIYRRLSIRARRSIEICFRNKFHFKHPRFNPRPEKNDKSFKMLRTCKHCQV
jgi:hypothetical protein